jgi:MFS family permease
MMGGSLIFGVAIGAPVGGYLTRGLGPRAPLLVAAVLFALLAAAALLLREGDRLRRGTPFRHIRRVLSSRPLLLFPLLCHFVDRLAVGLFVVIFPLYIDSLGATDPALRGRYLAYFLLPFAFLQFLTGRMAEQTGPLRPLIVGSAVYGLLLTAVGTADLLQLVPIMIGLGVAASVMFPPAILLTARLSDDRTRATAVGGFNLAGSLGFALGPLAGAFAFELQGYALAFVLCGLLELLLAAGGWMLLRRRPAVDRETG